MSYALGAFGADRMIWGSDWPVSTRHGSYHDSLRSIRDALPPGARDQVFRANAAEVYRLGPPPANHVL